jgi:hypothetical protein
MFWHSKISSSAVRPEVARFLDWAKTLRKEGSRSAIVRSDDLARKYGIAEAMVGNALRRQERRGLVEHVFRRLYVNKLR